MNDIFKIYGIKVTCYDSIDFPIEKRINRICNMIDESNLFRHVGNSRIDGYPIYISKIVEYERFYKINKLRGIDTPIVDNFIKLIKKIKTEIQISYKKPNDIHHEWYETTQIL